LAVYYIGGILRGMMCIWVVIVAEHGEYIMTCHKTRTYWYIGTYACRHVDRCRLKTTIAWMYKKNVMKAVTCMLPPGEWSMQKEWVSSGCFPKCNNNAYFFPHRHEYSNVILIITKRD